MPKISAELDEADIRRLAHSGGKSNTMAAIGSVTGLYIQITPRGAKSWILRTTVGTRRRDIGLGSFPTVTLAQACETAREARATIKAGRDPVEERRAAQMNLILAQGRGMTFGTAIELYLANKREEFNNDKQRKKWLSDLETYAMPRLGNMQLQDVAVQDLFCVLQPIWLDKHKMALRVQGLIIAVLSWANLVGYRTGDNPKQWPGDLKKLLPEPNRILHAAHQSASNFEEVIEFAVNFLNPLIKNGKFSDYPVEPTEYIYYFGLSIVQGSDAHFFCPTYYIISQQDLQYLLMRSHHDKGAFDLLSRIIISKLFRNEMLDHGEGLFVGQVLSGIRKQPSPEGKRLAKKFGQNVQLIYLSRQLHQIFGIPLTRGDENPDTRSSCDAVSLALRHCGMPKSYRAIKDLLTHKSSTRAREIVDQVERLKMEHSQARQELDMPTQP